MEAKPDASSFASLKDKLGWLAAGLGLGVLGALGVQKLLQKRNPNHRDTVGLPTGTAVPSDPSQKEFFESVMREQLERNYQFFGEEKQTQIRKSFVIVVGVGGVGSHVVNALVRSGVGKIRVIDFDLVSVSSLNRSAFALRKDVGKFKSQLLREYLLQINPQLELETVEEMFSGQTAERMLAGKPDMVVDCIDDITTKVDLLRYCLDHGLKVVSSGGAGMKADPTKIQIRDLSETNYDSLSRAVRVKLKEYGHQKGVMCIFSNEITERKLLDLNQDQAQDPEQYRALSKMRVRIVPVLGTMPSIFGMTLASYVLCALAGDQYSPAKTDDVKVRVYQKFVEQINKLCAKQKLEVDFDIEDVYFAAREVCEWRCSATGKKTSGLVLCIWDSSKPIDGRNMLLFSGKYVKDENSSQWNMKSYSNTFTEEEKARIEELLAKAASTYSRNMILMTNFENNK